MTNANLVLDALGDPTRRVIFRRLRTGARSVTEISRGMDITRSAVSQHLQVLKKARLAIDRAEGARRVYAIDARGVDVLRGWVDSLWDNALDRFKNAAELEALKGERQ
jgi:DNA-binding transcriptional ArsR family regulator